MKQTFSVARLVFALIVLSVLLSSQSAAAAGLLNLPTFPVQATYNLANPWPVHVTFNGIGSGYDVQDGVPYNVWCIERSTSVAPVGGVPYSVRLWSTYDPNLPANLKAFGNHVIPWDQINYLLNHKQGASGSDVAAAIWGLVEGTSTGLSIQLDAMANGTGFVPAPGQIVAVLVTDGSGITTTGDGWQENIIEVTVPSAPPTGPGTGTPGYWMNHPDAWPVSSITIGGVTYSKADAIAIMKKPVSGDKTYTMFPALVAAKLNVLIGNPSSCIASTITAADAWMAAHPVGSGVAGSSAAWSQGEPLSLALDQYNNGLLCAPHRD